MRKYLLDLNFDDGWKKQRRERRGRVERSRVSDRFLWLPCVMYGQGGVFSQLTVSISHLTDTQSERTLQSSEQEEAWVLYF